MFQLKIHWAVALCVGRDSQKFGLRLLVKETKKKMVTYVKERKKARVFDRAPKFTPTTVFAFVKGLYPDGAGRL